MVELAVHVRERSQLASIDAFDGPGASLPEGETLAKLFGGRPLAETCRRVYLGDEFCLHRQVDPKALIEFVRLAEERSWAVTLLTPPVTDDGLERCAPLFDRIDDPRLEAEVVVNDWGTLQFLRERHPSLRLSLGRLLNKGFKDPRLPDAAAFARMSEEAAGLLSRSTFDSPRFQDEMSRLRVTRFERDLLPHGIPGWEEPQGLGTSVYLPFGYVTMGRVCWLASFEGSTEEKFSLADQCHRSCRDLSLHLEDAQTDLKLLQEGNAVFYRYPASLLSSFLSWADGRDIRFVYQGLAIGVS
jgi:hypothetical protein